MSRGLALNRRRVLKRGRAKGVVLFVVTIIVTLASLAAYGFLVTMQGESQASRVIGNQSQAAHVGASGEEFLAVWLQASRAERSALASLNGDTIFSQLVTEPTLIGDVIPAGQFHIVVPNSVSDTSDPIGLQGTPTQQARLLGTDSGYPFRYGVINESSKLHLGTLLAWDSIWPGSARNALMKLPAMTPSTADAILDWIDKDNDTREFGAENDYYASLVPPRSVSNAIPRSIDDLLNVRGVTGRMLDGGSQSDAPSGAANAGLSSSQTPPSTFASTPQTAATNWAATDWVATNWAATNQTAGQPWKNFLTVFSAERNETYDGAARINLNDPELDELHRELLGRFPQDLADFVIYYRQFGPAANKRNGNDPTVTNVSINSANVFAERDVDLSLAPKFEFVSVEQLIDAVVVLPALDTGNGKDPEPQPVASPLSLQSGPNPEFSNWLDRLTVRSGKVILGRLNILTADPIVISALPVRDQSATTQIISGRSTLAHDSTTAPGISWLLTEQIFDREKFGRLARFLTTGGDVARFQVVATHPHSPLVDRFEVILDGTVKNTQRVHFRDLRRQGRPGMFEMFNQPPAVTTPSMAPSGFTQSR